MTMRVVEDVDDVVLSAAEAKALVAGDPDVLRRVQLQSEIAKLEALRAVHIDRQVHARWELKRLPQRIAELRARADAIAADVAFRDAHSVRRDERADSHVDITINGRTFTDRVDTAPVLAAAVVGAVGVLDDSSSRRIAAYRGFEVTVRPAGFGSIRLGLRCPDRPGALEYATVRTLDVAHVAAYGIGLFSRLDHVLEGLGAGAQGREEWACS
jgi:hypothetical protein